MFSKSNLRKTYKAQRLLFSKQEIEEKSKAICQHLFQSLPVHAYTNIHIFLPIELQNEVDTWLIINTLKKDFKATKIIVSKTVEDEILIHHYLKSDTQLIKNKWGVPEPIHAETVNPEIIDLVLVPLLIFDKKGHRTGYGKGCYDKFLASCRKDTIKVGLSFFEPVAEIEDINQLDIPLNFCITPNRVWSF
jgi:5-formyltetrahydrofolate cyclo-ligase